MAQKLNNKVILFDGRNMFSMEQVENMVSSINLLVEKQFFKYT